MQEAAKYFGKGSREGWRAAVEAEVVAVIDGGGNNEEENMIQSSGAEEVAAVVEEEENGVFGFERDAGGGKGRRIEI
ncbi:hypothetical protein D5086_028154 [Populus alba]|uniref:Uncharacterized protein n=1 Tax=Populus alba TaxID=43335 RepID=A0ACC4AXI2_POPAL